MKTLIKISGATVRLMDQVVFLDLDFEWKEGQHWAVIGNSGAELTAFLDTLLGRTMLTQGQVTRPFAKSYQEEKNQAGEVNSFRDLIAVVSQKYLFRNKSNLQNFYYQQRFNSSESEEAATVLEYLVELEPQIPGPWDISSVIQFLKLEELKNESLIKLSNGETRRLAIATALLKNPKILLMDQPLTGLDIQTRHNFDGILQGIIASGIHVILSTHSFEVPESISHVAVLGDKKIKTVLERGQLSKEEVDNSSLDIFNQEELSELLKEGKGIPRGEIVKLNQVHIQYGDKPILDNLSWTILAGEKWLLRGPNGAGKSTLLSLIIGENPQAYANDIWLFGKKRGTGESIWDIKKQIGFVAPELSRYFPANQTCLKVVLSGLFDTMGLFRKTTPEQEKLAMAWLGLFRLSSLAQKILGKVSLEDQRFVLLARALIKVPPLLILDEASQGMDEYQRILFKKTINQVCSLYPLTLIYVSHYQEDVPECVDKVFELKHD
ncbi:ATP-binding cassette domain-containing protein [Cecembia rubra]|uniref:Molybdate transport system ATP-binding protein n=1 Tax=Cecembia rubra TaxID=1485585 RepID=A0A2P8EAB9_9BACT|nr:ATP-binding cassette domain-containing protein [Cecembia rubra]PSL06421.1 molybdate transport system ATP-binding protein [Cecembia rubra]